jgi:hypothetical protein
VQKCVSFEPFVVPASRTFVTEDVYLAGALIALGKKYVTFFWRRGRANFELNEIHECEQIAQAYTAGDLAVPAKQYGEALRYLKARISEAVRKQKTVNVIP